VARDEWLNLREPGSVGDVPRGLHGFLVHQLGKRIVGEVVPPGHSLPTEEELSAQFGVSRTVLREAMRVLAAKGLVQSRPKKGTRVLPRASWSLLDSDVLAWQREVGPTPLFLHELEEVRIIIEPESAGLAAQRRSQEDVQNLQGAYETMRRAADADDRVAFLEGDVAFHAAILEACRNELLRQMGNPVLTSLRIRHDGTPWIPEHFGATLPEHEAVLTALCGRDVDRARRSMIALVTRAAQDDQYIGRVALENSARP
jgi:DNA-binding FadR family transcriptional regulator